MKQFYRVAWIALALMVGWMSQGVFAADLETIQTNRALGRVVTRYATTDGSTALRVKYIGASTVTPYMQIAADGNLEFYLDAVADTDVSTDGVIDVSGGTEDTFGEVVDVINASGDWVAYLVDVLPSTSANNVLTSTTYGATTTSWHFTDVSGHSLYYNTADLDMVSLSIGPEYTVNDELKVDNNYLLSRRSTPLVDTAPTNTNSSAITWCNELLFVTTAATYTSGAPDLKVYAVKSDHADATEILLWQSVGAATTVETTIPILPKQAPIKAPPGWRLVIQYRDTSTPDVTAGHMQIHGLSYAR